MRLIDADALDEVLDEFESLKAHAAFTEGIMVARRELTLAPTIDAEPVRHGRWIPKTYSISVCSVCEQPYFAHVQSWKYCPNCSAKMHAEEVIDR